jgi:inosine/xanthosine triphosphatase
MMIEIQNNMKKIFVASKNPVKINAVKEAFEKMYRGEEFEILSDSIPSGVSDQPLTDEETYKGAFNRVNNAEASFPNADFWVGIEGGIEDKNNEFEAFAWVVVKSTDGKYGKGRSATFFLPEKVSVLIKEGLELGDACDQVFDEHNAKQNQGTIGLLTSNNIDRTKYYLDPVIIALIPFKNPDLY